MIFSVQVINAHVVHISLDTSSTLIVTLRASCGAVYCMGFIQRDQVIKLLIRLTTKPNHRPCTCNSRGRGLLESGAEMRSLIFLAQNIRLFCHFLLLGEPSTDPPPPPAYLYRSNQTGRGSRQVKGPQTESLMLRSVCHEGYDIQRPTANMPLSITGKMVRYP